MKRVHGVNDVKIESKKIYYQVYTQYTISTMGPNNMNIPNEMKHHFKKTIAAAERARTDDEKICGFVVVCLVVICSAVLALSAATAYIPIPTDETHSPTEAIDSQYYWKIL